MRQAALALTRASLQGWEEHRIQRLTETQDTKSRTSTYVFLACKEDDSSSKKKALDCVFEFISAPESSIAPRDSGVWTRYETREQEEEDHAVR